MNLAGQVSLEYILILAAFFSVLALIIPIVNFSVEQLFFASDVVLIKQIKEKIINEDELFLLVANGSLKTFEFIPSKSINVKIKDKKINLISGEKEFEIEVIDSQENFEKEFSKKFYLNILKENNKTKFLFYN